MSQPEPDVNSYEQPNAELTPISQLKGGLSPLSSPTIEEHQEQHLLDRSDTLTFPTLESDGSLPDLREASTPARSYNTPPAALSSLGYNTRMADNLDMASSVDSLEDSSYDMMDDMSEITNDDRETASLASTDHAVSEDEGEMTPEEEEEGGDDFIKFNAGSVGDLADTLGVKQEQSTTEANRVIDSYMTDDLETPRQSTIRPSTSSTEATSSLTTTGEARQPKQKDAPISVRVALFCSRSEDYSHVAPNIGVRIASCLSGRDRGACEIVTLPPTPDSSEGDLLCRCGNLEIAISQSSPLASYRDNSSPRKQSTMDLIVVYLDKVEEYHRTLIDGFHAEDQADVPIMVLTKTEEDKQRIEDELNCDVLAAEAEFLDGDDVTARLKLLSVFGESLLSKGWRPVSSSQGKTKTAKSDLLTCVKRGFGVVPLILGAVLLLGMIQSIIASYTLSSSSSVANIETQLEALHASVTSWANDTNVDIDTTLSHLLPRKRDEGAVTIIFPPNRLILSVTEKHSRGWKSATATASRAGGNDLPTSLHILAGHVFGVTIPVEEVHGVITVRVHLVYASYKPATEVEFTHDFGSRMWKRGTYEKASTDLAKAINKDVAVARNAAKSLTDRVSLEFAAGVAATQNVTNQLAVRMTRDVQLFGGLFVDKLKKSASQTVNKAEQISKDLAVVRKDLIERADDFKKSLATTAHSIKDLIVPSKKTFTSPLVVSRQRALGLKDAVAGKKQDAATSKKPDAASKAKTPQQKKLDGQRDERRRRREENGAGKCAKCKSKKKCKACL